MLVVITRPIEEAVNSVLFAEGSVITSRGSAEVDLFFDWNADMILPCNELMRLWLACSPNFHPTPR